ncbi:hypothetical protein [Nocardia thailandica]|uniref:hypothetical protein n=1 Tax=Nocardia thailandica TaxID=257275 RepID=UPI0002D59AFD|nr:hypothetical protein [Nocardia thailandica]
MSEIPGGVRLTSALLCGFAAVLAAPFAAAFTAAVYRFPIPLDGYARGIDEIWAAGFASLFYLVLGGGFLLAALGIGLGWALSGRYGTRPRRSYLLSVAAGVPLALAGAWALALLAHVIGPW